jgi:shikimate dehydrogenase
MSTKRMLVGLIGANIMGSLSPALFADAFAAAGIHGFYHLLDVDRLPGRTLPQLLDAIRATGFAGVNITFPFKQQVMPLLDAIDLEAAQVGAVNTVAMAPDGRTTGYNYDRRGWRNAFLEKFGAAAAKGATVVMVGAGGAGRAVAFALMDLEIDTLIIHDQDAARAKGLVADIVKHFGVSRARVAGDVAREVASAGGVVNATQIGMRGFPGNPIPTQALTAAHWCADVIYTPLETEFIKAAAAKGSRVMSGDGMCVHQAVEAFRRFTGVTPDVQRLHRAFAAGLAEREAAYAKAS